MLYELVKEEFAPPAIQQVALSKILKDITSGVGCCSAEYGKPAVYAIKKALDNSITVYTLHKQIYVTEEKYRWTWINLHNIYTYYGVYSTVKEAIKSFLNAVTEEEEEEELEVRIFLANSLDDILTILKLAKEL